jgi:hypothetical protein
VAGNRFVWVGAGITSVATIVAVWLATGFGGGGGVSTCPAPRFPDTSCTGVPAGVTLTPYTGPQAITADNTVIDGALINEPLEIDASNVTIKNSKMTGTTCTATSGCSGINVPDDGRSYGKQPLQLLDSEIDCGGFGTGISSSNIIARRVLVHGCENGFNVDQNIDVRDSMIEYLLNTPDEVGHPDGVQFGCGHWDPTYSPTGGTASCAEGFAPGAKDITFVHNTILAATKDGVLQNSAFIMNGASPPIPGPQDGRGVDTNILIQGNLLAGGGYTLYCAITKEGGDAVVPQRAHHRKPVLHPLLAARRRLRALDRVPRRGRRVRQHHPGDRRAAGAQ